MVDNNLNPGDQRYNDLYSGQGGVNELRDLSAVRDYSASKDFSSLKQGEQNAINQYTTASDRDIRQQEAASHMDASSFDKIMSMDTKKLDEKRYNQMSSFKKRIFGGVLVFLTGGGLLMGIGTAISGPMQLIQAAELINDFQLAITTGQQAARALRTTNGLVNMANSSISNSIQKSRLGILGKKQADIMDKRLKENGIDIHTNTGGFQSGGIDIDTNKVFGGAVGTKDIDAAADLLGVSANKIEILDNGLKIRVKDNLSYSEAKRFIKAVDDPGKWKLSSWMQGRVTLKKLGYTSWLHPIEKAKTKAYKKTVDFIDNVVGKITKKSNVSGEINNRQNKYNDNLGDENKLTGEDLENRKAGTSEVLEESIEVTNDFGGRKIFKAVSTDPVEVVLSKVFSPKTLGILGAITTVVCFVKEISESVGVYKQSNIVNVAEKGSATILGYGSQVKSGEDIDLDSAKLAVKMALGDDIPVADLDGKETDKTEFSSYWSAAPVCAATGNINCDTSNKTVPEALTGVADPANFTGNKSFNEIINGLFSSSIGGLLTGGICYINDIVGSAIEKIAGFVLGPFINLLTQWLGSFELIGNFLASISSFVRGTPLDLASATPKDWGAVAMYGGKFMANDQARGVGGRELNNKAAIELNLENRRYLAWEHSRKSLLARLADPSDYASSVNYMARAINLNTSSQDFGTQLANVIKTFTSAPTLIATASNQLLGGSAYAASTYDYGVPTFAYSIDEFNEILENENYDLINNTERAIHLLDGSDKTKYYNYAQKCLSVEISKDESHSVKMIDYSDEGAGKWTYVDNTGNTSDAAYCNERSTQDNYKTIRLYVMDYFNTTTGACYYGDDKEGDVKAACNELGMESTGSSTGAVSTAGNQDPEVWQKSFASETSGVYKSPWGDTYYASSNGCTTVAAWFIGAHTTLTYGRGHGKDVVNNLKQANPQLEVTNKPTKAPSIFSAWEESTMTSSSCCGHVGLVTAIDPDGTIHTLETGSKAGQNGNPWSFTKTWSPSDYATNANFVYVGDYLK